MHCEGLKGALQLKDARTTGMETRTEGNALTAPVYTNDSFDYCGKTQDPKRSRRNQHDAWDKAAAKLKADGKSVTSSSPPSKRTKTTAKGSHHDPTPAEAHARIEYVDAPAPAQNPWAQYPGNQPIMGNPFVGYHQWETLLALCLQVICRFSLQQRMKRVRSSSSLQ